MEAIRENVFETNSSSVHSLALSIKPLSNKIYLNED